MTVFVSDTFTDTDAVLLQNHTPETGGAWIRRSGFDTLEIINNELKASSFQVLHYTNNASPGSADYNINFDWNFSSTGNSIGVFSRYLDASNRYLLLKQKSGSSQRLKLFKMVSGFSTELDIITESLVVGIEAGRFELSGATQKGFAGGVEKVSGTDSELTLVGFTGLYFVTNASFRMDNYIVNDTATPSSTTASMQSINVWWQRD